jgi:RNA polymerase sigma-70 factor, ECF subfamily
VILKTAAIQYRVDEIRHNVMEETNGRAPLSLACTQSMNSTRLYASLNALKSYANDTNVMFGVRARDRVALEKLYLTYYGPLARFLSRVVAHTSAVDEIINDTFMTIWKNAREFCGESSIAAWIFGIAYRTALQSIGPHRAQGTLPPVEIFRGRNTDLASQNAYIDRLESRLNHMPLEERVTLALAYQMGFSIDEISAITQVAPATVNVRMFQARTRLRDKT